jgi:hypothetical protein
LTDPELYTLLGFRERLRPQPRTKMIAPMASPTPPATTPPFITSYIRPFPLNESNHQLPLLSTLVTLLSPTRQASANRYAQRSTSGIYPNASPPIQDSPFNVISDDLERWNPFVKPMMTTTTPAASSSLCSTFKVTKGLRKPVRVPVRRNGTRSSIQIYIFHLFIL